MTIIRNLRVCQTGQSWNLPWRCYWRFFVPLNYESEVFFFVIRFCYMWNTNSNSHITKVKTSSLHQVFRVNDTAKHTVISTNFLVCKFCGKANFALSFGSITWNYSILRCVNIGTKFINTKFVGRNKSNFFGKVLNLETFQKLFPYIGVTLKLGLEFVKSLNWIFWAIDWYLCQAVKPQVWPRSTKSFFSENEAIVVTSRKCSSHIDVTYKHL